MGALTIFAFLCNKQEQSDFHDMGSAQFKGMGGLDPAWINADIMRGFSEPTYSGHKRLQVYIFVAWGFLNS